MTNEELLTQLTKRIDVAEQRVMQLVESHSQELKTLGHQTNSRFVDDPITASMVGGGRSARASYPFPLPHPRCNRRGRSDVP